jgi:hypothetical protein
MPGTGHVASSTVTAPVGSQAQGSILSRAELAVRQAFFTSDDMKSPERLYQVLRILQQNISSALRQLAQNPTLGGTLQRGLVFVGGTPLPINHGLGRAYAGFFCVRAQGAVWAGVEVALPAGVTAAQQIVLTTASSGTFDLVIF